MGWGGWGGGFRCITEFSLAEAEAVTIDSVCGDFRGCLVAEIVDT